MGNHEHGCEMARTESDREDLMREAIALTERAELQCEGFRETVICGFRDNGSLSIYFGQDPVYQFDSDGLLRRAYVDGLLFRSQQSTLARLRRERTEKRTMLVRTDLESTELLHFRDTMGGSLQRLHAALQQSRFTVMSAVPEGNMVADRALRMLNTILQQHDTWLSSTIRARRM